MSLNLKRLTRILLRSILTAALVLIVAAVILIFWVNHEDRLLRWQFQQIANGMTKEQVLFVMGKPDSIGRCGELGALVPSGCVQEYFYKPKLTVSTLAVFFNSQERVVGKYDYESP